MKILHLLSGGGIGGIEVLCRDIAKLSQEQNEFCFLYDGGEIAEEMKRQNIPVYFYYKENLLNRALKLFQLVKKKQYDVVVVHHEGAGIYSFYLMLLYCFKKVRFIKYLHCSYEEKYFYQGHVLKDRINYRILKKTLTKSDHLVAVSEFVKQSYCREFGCDPDKVKVIYNGIKILQNTDRKERIQGKNESVRLLYIGRLIEVKGVHLLLHAVKKLLDLGENIELDILGDGPMRFEYENLTKNLGMGEIVHFQGYTMEKQKFYEQAKIFVYPSVWQEAFGISIVEAMNQEMLCVASDAGGIPEIIDEGKDGFLFQNGDIDNLTETLLRAINCSRSQKYWEMTAAAKQKSLKFDINNMIDELQKVYQSESF